MRACLRIVFSRWAENHADICVTTVNGAKCVALVDRKDDKKREREKTRKKEQKEKKKQTKRKENGGQEKKEEKQTPSAGAGAGAILPQVGAKANSVVIPTENVSQDDAEKMRENLLESLGMSFKS
jgi:hypothetical protein